MTPKPKRKSTVQPRDNRVAANASRAAQIFGVQDSLFTGRAKVSALGLQRGVSEMIRRVYSCVPGVAPMKVDAPAIKVTYIGEQACARYTWGRAAGSKLAVAGVINLPATGEPDALIPRSVADQYTGKALHEMGHFLYTPLAAFDYAIRDAAQRFNVSQDFAKSVINSLEDVAEERELIRSGYAPGAGAMLRALVEKCTADIPRSAYGTIKAFPVTLAFGLRGYTPATRPLIAALPPALRAIYDACAHDMAALPPRVIGDVNSMQPVIDASFRVLASLAALRDAQPPQPPEEGEPGEGEPGEEGYPGGEPGEGEPGEGEPGEGEPGEGEPGEGEPGEGEPGEGEPGEGEPGEGEPGEGEPGEGEPGNGESSDGEGDDIDDGEGDDIDDDDLDTGDMGEHGDKGRPGDTLPPNPSLPPDATPDPVEPRDDGDDGEGADDRADNDDGEPGEHDVGKDEGSDDRPDALDTRSLEGTPLDSDMQPEQAGEPGDGASGLANDAVRVVKAVPASTWDTSDVADKVKQALTSSAKVAHGLRTLLDTSARDAREGGHRNGSLDMGALARIRTGAENVFERREYRDGSDAAVTILIDQSSSMNMDQRYIAARTLAGTLSKIIAGCAGVRVEILGFHSGGGTGMDDPTLERLIEDVGSDADGDMWRSLKGDCCVTVFKAFSEPHSTGMARLGSCYGSGGTPDAAALTHAAQRLHKETADQHILIVIADGEGSPRDVLAKIVSRIEREGTMLIAIGIEQDMCEAFTHRAKVDDVAKLNESGLHALLRALAQGELAADIRAGND